MSDQEVKNMTKVGQILSEELKKKYQKPTPSLILVRTEQMISASIIDN